MILAGLALRASIVMLAALLAAAALRRQSAALRHWVLAAGVFCAVLVAPLSVVLPAWDWPQAAVTAAPAAAGAIHMSDAVIETRPAGPAPTTMAVEEIGLAVWGAGLGAGALLMFRRFRRLRRLTRAATPLTDARWLARCRALSAEHGVAAVALLRTDQPDVLATWGWRRPCVLLPPDCGSWPDARIRVVLHHELAHIRRADWAVQIAAECVRTVLWFDPLFWIASARLRRESELACDDLVVGAGVPPGEYASHLVDLARACRPFPSPSPAALSIARPSTLEWRITAMLNTTVSRMKPTRVAMATAVAALIGLAAPVATFQAAQSAPLPFEGFIYDVSGGVLPQVAVTLEDANGAVATTTTDASGRFAFDPVNPGGYTLKTSIPGFRPLSQAVTLKVARDWRRDITLQVGTLQETITVRGERPSPGRPAAAPAEPVRIGGNIRPPRKLVDVRPEYPVAMLEGGFAGVVPMEAYIDVDGNVASVRVSSAQVHPDLARSAVEAVRQWRFSPTLLNGVAVEVLMTVTVEFRLPD